VKLKLPSNCIDITSQMKGTVITFVGAEVFRRQMRAGAAGAITDGSVIADQTHVTTSSAQGNDTTSGHEGGEKP
jgi:hypothetical protein